MKKEYDEKLCKDFPNLYRKRNCSPMESCMYFGFEHGDGWFQIIYDLSGKLEKLILQLPENEREQYYASQVKEKLGTLRFYMSTETDEMEEAIREAEDLTEKTCEWCSKEGELRNENYWYITLCDDCLQARRKEREKWISKE